MSDDRRDYLEFLSQVEAALAEALDGGIVDKDAPQYAEFVAMRQEVVAIRDALSAPDAPCLREVALGS